ncbi:uncharacterized protein LOC135215820 [Macrobrachium nipponense]|uniref:uncharacterized protein LOC135215820 n=1 Tax=Macrobrachium nipponense TaxID=159736 RepID=UPI0030C7BBAD
MGKTLQTSVVTLAPYIPHQVRRNFVGRKSLEESGGCVPNEFDKYLTITFEDKVMNIFEVHRDIVKCCGREPKILPHGRNKLLVETRSLEESEKLKSLNLLGGVQSECKPHDTFNHTKGIIYAPHLMIHPEEELEDELKDQGVLKVERLKKKVNGALCPMPQLLLTFNSSKLPNFVKAAWYRYKVKQYVPRPRRCFYCQEYGHIIGSCRSKLRGNPAICINCGEVEHGDCHAEPKCIHCGEAHQSSSNSCDVFLFEKERSTIY